METHDHGRAPEVPRKAKAVSHRAEMRVQHVVVPMPRAESGQAVKGRQARRLIPVFAAAEHLKGQRGRMREATEELGECPTEPDRVVNGSPRLRRPGASGDRPDRHLPGGSLPRHVHKRRPLQQTVPGDLHMDRSVGFGPRVRVNFHFMAKVEQPGDLAQYEGLGDDGKAADEHRDAQRLAHKRSLSRSIDWNTSA